MATNNTNWLSQALSGADFTRTLREVMAQAVRQVSTGSVASQLSPFQANTVAESTQAVLSGAVAASSGGSSVLGTVGNIASQVLGSGLGITSLIGGLVKLFGGGDDSSAAEPLTEYTLPEALSFEGQVSRAANTTDWTATQGFRTGTPAAAPAQQITVQVNAMDSKSFLDHSDDIARAVRQAMLNSHSLNDVVNDL